jgi:hypothetical protein
MSSLRTSGRPNQALQRTRRRRRGSNHCFRRVAELGVVRRFCVRSINRAILIILLTTASVFAGAPWPGVDYTEVRAFAWAPTVPPAIPPEELIHADMTFADGVINKAGTLLNATQVKRLLAAQARRHKPRGAAGCYSPHNAFVFYAADTKPVAYLELCFDCFGAKTHPADKDCDPDFLKLARLCAELKLPSATRKTPKEYEEEFRMVFGRNTK